jgi:uncharacterized protein (TIGR02757 family)
LPGIAKNDPVEFVHRYSANLDREVAGFLASQFAYGKIELFKRFLTSIFERMGSSPNSFIQEGIFTGFNDLYYRFQKGEDIVDLFNTLKKILDEFGSIGNMMEHFYQGDTREALWKVRDHYFKNNNKLTFFFPKPIQSSPLKRWSLYFRWMVRKDEVDAGLWSFINKKNLIIPLDTHIFKIGRCLGWTECKTPTYRAAKEITDALKKFSPEDPLKYDLFLCHRVGIGAECTGKKTAECKKKCVIC